MVYRPQNDVIDPEVAPQDETIDASSGSAENVDDSDVIGEDGRVGVNLELSEALGRREFAPPQPWLKPAAVALALLFVALTGWNIWRLTHPASILPTPTPFQVKQALYLGVMRVEAYRKVHGVTPERLEDAGLPSDSGYTYGRIDSKHYNLAFERDGRSFDYNSDVPVESAFGSPKEMLSIGGSR